ncbi:hypothetical protein [Parasediminibacterium sp. JCM 36343]|uniref:hypothetical protein n=1 Tax=Parasediminibacterium sp. JCM 36343 TaxID=3374279 RepID=UPI00397E2F69
MTFTFFYNGNQIYQQTKNHIDYENAIIEEINNSVYPNVFDNNKDGIIGVYYDNHFKVMKFEVWAFGDVPQILILMEPVLKKFQEPFCF